MLLSVELCNSGYEKLVQPGYRRQIGPISVLFTTLGIGNHSKKYSHFGGIIIFMVATRSSKEM